MTRLLTCGYETGDVNEAGVGFTDANSSLAVVNTSPVPRVGGAYCLKAQGTFINTNTAYKGFGLGAPRTELWIRFGFWAQPGSGVGTLPFAAVYDSTATAQASLFYDGSDGYIRAYTGIGFTLLGTASVSFATGAWHLVEWHMQILTATTGTTEVWLDGVRVINFSGDNTQTATLNMQTLRLGLLATQGQNVTSYFAYDDIAVNDTGGIINNGQIGDGRIVLLTPSGAGANTALTRGGTDSGANWSQVDELPPSMTDYVYSTTVGNRDTYALTDLPSTAGTINVVEAVIFGQNSDAGAGAVGPTIKSGSTTNEVAALNLTTTAGYVGARWETDPNTGLAWTPTAVNAAEVGVTVR